MSTTFERMFDEAQTMDTFTKAGINTYRKKARKGQILDQQSSLDFQARFDHVKQDFTHNSMVII